MKLIPLTFLVLPLLAAAAVAASSETEFDTPSHNMCCHFIPGPGNSVHTTLDGSDELNCSRVEPKYWTVTLTALGKMKVYKNPGEVPGCGSPNILQYGQSQDYGDFNCVSETSGLTCLNANGKGFKLSKTGLKKIKP
jgi:hypothetical protein